MPVFALSPSQGDVDILIAAELMEAGRAILRGFVTPERTTLIASSHRIAAVSEKVAPGDGRASSQKVHETAEAAAKHLANALCYDDMIRVADLKTRSTRGRRVRREVGVKDGSVLQVTEYFHPRIEEFCGTLPAGLGRYIEERPKLAGWLDRRINHGRRIRTDSFAGFAMLWFVGGLRRWRRSLLRHEVEASHLDRWYRLALDHVPADYALGVEILECRRLIKGYSDTHVRSQSKFDRVLSGLELVKGRDDAADWIRRLREAALKDEKGDMLDGALKTVESL
jgi:indolepyruvate ferredoxin oxidoreductase beta subunit